MIWPFNKKQIVEAKPAHRPSVFSNELPAPFKPGQLVDATFARTFQRDASGFRGRDASGASVALDDAGLATMAAGYGFTENNIPEAQFAWYASQGFMGWQICAMLSQHWLINKACTMPARDAVRQGFEITVNDGRALTPEQIDYMRKRDKFYRLNHNLVQFVRMGRIFGIRLCLFRVESTDPQYYEKPFNPDGVTPGSYRGMSQVDPYWISPELSLRAASDPAAQDFYEPTWWRINGKRYHKSHFAIFRPNELPDILKPSYLYGGVPVPQMIMERVYAAERTANEAPQLAMTKRTTVLNIENIEAALGDETEFRKNLAQWLAYRDNYQIKVNGAGDSVEQFDTSLTDLDEVIMTQFQLVAAAANVPATKLLGTPPKGFNSTGEFETDSYHEELESIQESDLTPLVERHHLCVMRSDVTPKYGATAGTSVNWNPVDPLKTKEQAEVNKLKAETDNTLVQAGAIDGDDIRNRLISDKDSGYDGLKPGAPEPEEPAVDPLALMAQAGNDPEATGGIGEDAALFDPTRGTLADAALITAQTYLDAAKVRTKIEKRDFAVQLSPQFVLPGGQRVHAIMDGHHSFFAAVSVNEQPVFEFWGPEQMGAIGALFLDTPAFLAQYMADRGGDVLYNFVTRKPIV
jgi:phage-related protein (TIGR01555 family)